jgi:hypothetical protein
MNIFKKSKFIIAMIMLTTSISATSTFADEKDEHQKEHNAMETKMLNEWKSTMTVISTNANDFLDMGDKMIRDGMKAKDPAMMQKGAELMKMGVKMSQEVIDFDHEHLATEIPHEIMHKKHMGIKTKLSDLISGRSKDFINMGEELVKAGKGKNDGDQVISGAKLISAGMEMQMMNHPKK